MEQRFTSWNSEELDRILASFETIQGELNYQQAQDALGALVSNLDLTPREKIGLEGEIAHLSAMLAKLEQSVVQIAAFGMVGRGKSSILNALLGEPVFQTGALHGVTQVSTSKHWQLSQENLAESDQEIQKLTIPGLGKSSVELIDTPGIDEVDGETREALARDIAKQADLILMIIAGDLTKVEYQALCELREFGKPILLVFNKIDQYPEADALAIYEKIRDDRVKELLSPEEIVMVAASPLVVEASSDSQGHLKIQRRRGVPQIEELKLKILEILAKEGKSLVALNTMLYADQVNERLLARKILLREQAANELIWKGVMTKSLAIALNPVTVFDLFTGGIVDVVMILALSRLYGIPMTHTAALGLLQKIAISLGGISASEILASFGLSSIKGLLGLVVPATGGASLAPYASVALTQGAVAGVSSYAIAQVTKTYLAHGASWGPEGPKTVVQSILNSLDETSILSRIKAELRAKLGRKYLKEGF
ncbi:GTP-binding protein [Gloeocapsa sp. PCC 73106]|uniref:GTP-binding protein n=1 Tax=Gloeocapsa sp. PCC 73106 TaxID=102232 RepID=UPI0002AC7AFA|nr:GTP-binding protein [Gloeocapsa sp. PCC 73106]ELR96776.1 small G protein, GTPase SAR1 [Gloeocapsa sp. PCC 73106]